jgi:DNA-binding NtrC family response regulator
MGDKKANILVVDDDEHIRTYFTEILQDEYNVFSAEDVSKGLEIAKNNAFDIYLVDYEMPDMYGTDFIREAHIFSKNAVSIMISSFTSLEIAVEIMKAGAHDYLIKPVNVDELKKCINNILKERELAEKGKLWFKEVILRQQEINPSDEGEIIKIV